MSKFSTLPDIDLSAVDVYETASSPELGPTKASGRRGTSGRGAGGGLDSGLSSDDDDDNDGGHAQGGGGGGGAGSRIRRRGKPVEEDDGRGTIEKKGIAPDEAMARFQNSTDAGSQGQSSVKGSRGRRRPLHPHYIESDVYQLDPTASRAVETPLARLRRLRMEAEELEQELSASQSPTGQEHTAQLGAEGASRRAGTTEPKPEVLLAQLRALKDDLGNLKVDPAHEARIRASRVETAKEVLRAIEGGEPEAAAAAEGAASPGQRQPSQGASAPPLGSAALANVEERLASLEGLIGSNQGVLEETQSLSRPLLPTLSRLEHLSTLLTQPRHIDAISKRIKVLVSELDRVYESRRRIANLPGGPQAAIAALVTSNASGGEAASDAGGQKSVTAPLDPIMLSKLDDLFALSSRVRPLLPLAPALLQRLRSLSTLHASASGFAASLSGLEQSQGEVKAGQEEMAKAMESLEESLKANDERLKDNLASVMARMEELERRVAAL